MLFILFITMTMVNVFNVFQNVRHWLMSRCIVCMAICLSPSEQKPFFASAKRKPASSSLQMSVCGIYIFYIIPVYWECLIVAHGFLVESSRARSLSLSRLAAARGLDLPALDCIVQYDPPEETTEYIHRVGRCARLGRKGEAVLFLRPEEMAYLEVLKKFQVG